MIQKRHLTGSIFHRFDSAFFLVPKRFCISLHKCKKIKWLIKLKIRNPDLSKSNYMSNIIIIRTEKIDIDFFLYYYRALPVTTFYHHRTTVILCVSEIDSHQDRLMWLHTYIYNFFVYFLLMFSLLKVCKKICNNFKVKYCQLVKMNSRITRTTKQKLK